MLFSDDVTLPRISNREDLYLLVGIYDDDTGDPIVLSGATGSGTYTGWNVGVKPPGTPPTTPNVVTTTSTSTMTIMDGQQTLVVGRNLAIVPNQNVAVAPLGISFLTTGMYGTVVSYVAATGSLVMQVGKSFQFEIRRQQPRNISDGYVAWWGIGTTADYGPLIVVTNGTGITVVDVGIIQIEILETQIRQLCTPNFGNTFGVGLTMTDGYSTRQIFSGSLPVTYGGVTN